MQRLQIIHGQRRPFPLHVAFVMAVLAYVAACGGPNEEPRLSAKALNATQIILEDVENTEVRLHPERVDRLGLTRPDKNRHTSRFSDLSQAGYERRRMVYIDLLNKVRTAPALPSDHPAYRDLAITYNRVSRLIDIQSRNPGYVSLSLVRPYTIDPFHGAWIGGPDLLLRDHPLNTPADAQNYVARLGALADGISDIRRRLLADARVGALPPAVLLIETKREIATLLAPNDEGLDALLSNFAALLPSIEGIDRQTANGLQTEAQRILDKDLKPAYRGLVETIEAVLPNARAQVGIWAAPDGDGLYRDYLRWYLDTDSTPEALHTINMTEVEARRRALLATRTSKGALREAEALGAVALEAPAAGDTAAQTPPVTLPFTTYDLVAFKPSGPNVSARRLDGRRPQQIQTSRRALAIWPEPIKSVFFEQAGQFALHEYQSTAPQTRALLARQTYDTAVQRYMNARNYINVEDLTPAQRGAWQHVRLIDAARAAADTGLHHERWSLDRTIDFIYTEAAVDTAFARALALDIAAAPGEATAALAAERRLETLQARVRAVLGAQYSETAFQKVILTPGPRPFDMIEADIEKWYETTLANTQN